MNVLVCIHRDGTRFERACSILRTSVSLPKLHDQKKWNIQQNETGKKPGKKAEKQKARPVDEERKMSMLQANKAYPRLQNASFLNILAEGRYEHRSNLASVSR